MPDSQASTEPAQPPESRTSQAPYERPLPHPYVEDLPHWEGARQGELRLPRCEDCGELWWPPSPVCPSCLSERIVWLATSGRGRVVSWVVFHKAYYPAFAADLPYNVAWIELEEGPRLTSTLSEVDPSQIAIGLPVEVVFDPVTPEVTLPRFRPSRS